jgi:Protein of unknown function (DUF3253)
MPDTKTIDPAIDQAIETQIMSLLVKRGEGSSICPSDAPRSLYADWRNYMLLTRSIAFKLAIDGKIRITQGEKTFSLESITKGDIKGAIRLRLA